jgi:hypothetical protein
MLRLFMLQYLLGIQSKIIQSPSEYWTSLVFRWLICVLKPNVLVFKWHLNTGQTCPVLKWSISIAYILWSENQSGLQMVKNKRANFSILKPDKLCPENEHLNTWLSGFQMVTVVLNKITILIYTKWLILINYTIWTLDSLISIIHMWLRIEYPKIQCL